MAKENPNRRVELIAMLVAAVIVVAVAIAFVFFDPNLSTAPDIRTDSQKAVDPAEMAPQQ